MTQLLVITRVHATSDPPLIYGLNRGDQQPYYATGSSSGSRPFSGHGDATPRPKTPRMPVTAVTVVKFAPNPKFLIPPSKDASFQQRHLRPVATTKEEFGTIDNPRRERLQVRKDWNTNLGSAQPTHLRSLISQAEPSFPLYDEDNNINNKKKALELAIRPIPLLRQSFSHLDQPRSEIIVPDDPSDDDKSIASCLMLASDLERKPRFQSVGFDPRRRNRRRSLRLLPPTVDYHKEVKSVYSKPLLPVDVPPALPPVHIQYKYRYGNNCSGRLPSFDGTEATAARDKVVHLLRSTKVTFEGSALNGTKVNLDLPRLKNNECM